MFPELVAQEGKIGVEFLTVVTGLSHRGTWRWKGLGLAGDLLEDLSFVEHDRVGRVEVEQKTSLVLLDTRDGKLHMSGAGKHWSPSKWNQGRLVDIHGSNSDIGTPQWNEGRGRRRRREANMVEVNIADGDREGLELLESLLSSGDPD